ncbi:MAG: TIM barrel protein, partial [Thermoguttaceae bacterium]
MFLGYNTNGMAHHDLFEAVELMSEIGYRGAAITIDHGALWPRDKGIGKNIIRLKNLLRDLEMHSAIETGARFLLDPRVKHEPTLVSADPRRRIDFYKYAVDCAAELGSDCVSLWSGTVRDGVSRHEAEKRLARGLDEVLD